MGKRKKKTKQSAGQNNAKPKQPAFNPGDMPGVTIFCLPKAFAGPFDLIQRNAIHSWLQLEPRPEIIVMGDDPGVRDFAVEAGLRYIAEVEKNEYGTPLVNRLFEKAEASAAHDLLVYVNADIILTGDFLPGLYKVQDSFESFLMIGRRWDMEIDEPIDFTQRDWEKKLRKQLTWKADLHSVNGIDCFAFSRGLWSDIPPFAIGRTAWDNWLVYDPIHRQVPVIDATEAVTLIHQGHDYSHAPGGQEAVWHGPEAQYNKSLITVEMMAGVTSSATWELGPKGLKPRADQKDSRADRIARVQKIYTDGLELMERGHLSQAIDKFNDALRLCHDFTVTNVNLSKAIALARLDRPHDAVAALQLELKMNPNNSRASHLLGQLAASGVQTGIY